MEANVTTISEAANKKDCGRNAIYRAIERGDLHTTEVGKQDMVLLDAAFNEWQPVVTGFRKRKLQRESQGDE